MRIVGLVKNSVVDYPGKMAAVIFSPGCNLDCYYCQNRPIIGPVKPEQSLPEAEVFAFLQKRRGLLDGVVFSGGEPTLQADLAAVMRKAKDWGYLVKLDTNGTNPAVLRTMVEQGLVDYVAMDLKAPFHKYAMICGEKSNTILDNIRESIAFLMTGKVPYEFRTTVVPELNEEDVLAMAAAIKGARLYVLQQYRVPDFVKRAGSVEANPSVKVASERQDIADLTARATAPQLLLAPHPPAFLRALARKASGLVEKVETRGI